MKNRLSERIAIQRKKLNLNQIKASNEIGISYSTLSKVEQGYTNVTDEILSKIERWLKK